MTQRTVLPLLPTGPHGSRSRLTCVNRCGDACFKPMPNESGNTEFHEIAARAIARRTLLQGAGVGAGALVISGLVSSPAAAHGPGSSPHHGGGGGHHGVGTADFTPVPPNVDDEVTVPAGYRADVLIRWGDPVTRDAHPFDVDNQSGEAAATQFGYNNDYVGVLPHGRRRALLVCNHEYTDAALMFPTGAYDAATRAAVEIANHGMSVVEIRRGRRAGSWKTVNHRSARRNRRITADSPFEIVGPAAGAERLTTSADPTGRRALGTINNCAGGMTPWGTVVSGEENFNFYFDASGATDPTHADSYKRYGITGSGRGWSVVDPRWDLTEEPHEPFRFGWIVEIDPTDPKSTPRKHTMLGRFKHEGANIVINKDGHAVAYMGDDERGDYIYKFVSRDHFDPRPGKRARRRNMSLLTAGTLYVAKFEGDGLDDGVSDGTGTWIPLTSDTTSYVDGMSVEDVLIDTRVAADKVGPTKMDRPEDIEPNPVNGKVYCALTNNSRRGSTFPVDEANPLGKSRVRKTFQGPLVEENGNRNGYVLEMDPPGGDHTATSFGWNLILVCGDPDAPETYFAGYPKQLVSPISCPDNVAFDKVGNLWVATDGAQLGAHDGLFRVPVEGPHRGHVEAFASVPVGAETCGPLITEDQKSVFIAVQHPGETDTATFENPTSTWPHTDPFPRPSVVVIHRA